MDEQKAALQCDSCAIGRREFMSRSVITAAAALLATACGTGVWEPLSPVVPTGGVTLRLADYPALAAVGGIALVTPTHGTPLAIVHSAASSYLALSRICPHQGTVIDLTGNSFVCPNHGARFDSRGRWTGGQPTSSLVALSLSYDATAGTLLIGA